MNPERLKFLQQLKAADLKRNVPSISIKTAQFLHSLVVERECKSGLEIGTAHAYSTIWLGDAFEQAGGHLTTIEHSPPSFNQAKVNIYRAKLETTITQHQGKAQDLLSESGLSTIRTHMSPDSKAVFDFIFIDGQKTQTLDFLNLVTPLLSNKGMIVVDDVIKFKTKMQTFYDWLKSQDEWQYTIHQLDDDDGIMVIERAV